MKCVAKKRCQTRKDDGKIRTYAKGDIDEFKKCPKNFTPIAGESEEAKIDFATAGEEELLAADYDLEELKAFIEETYKKKAGKRGKDKLVEFLLDCRFRSLGDVDLNKLV